MWKKSLSLLIAISFVTSCIHAQKDGLRKRIAVFEFQDKTSSQSKWWDSQTIGQAISEMIITELAQREEFRVIELDDLQESGKELPFNLDGINNAESAAEAGRAIGAEVAIYGVVTEFGMKQDDREMRISGLRVGGSSQSAVVGMDIRMINANTGEILFAESIRESKSSVSPDLSYQDLQFESQNSFDESIVGKATRKAVEKAAKLIDKNAEDIPWSAKVVTNQNGQVYINCGAIDGVEKGMMFAVYRQGKALIDPDTGISLGKIDEKIGALKVEDPMIGQGKASLCVIVNGMDFERGDVVRVE